MPLQYNTDSGLFEFAEMPDDLLLLERSHASYLPALLQNLNSFNELFKRAFEISEFWSIWTLLGVRGLQDAGWDPFESTKEAIQSVSEHFSHVGGQLQSHLSLWVYGHILEASEHYEVLHNMVSIAAGGAFNTDCFRALRQSDRQPSPGTKIAALKVAAMALGLGATFDLLQETWDRNLRNAIFHSDYSVHGPEVRIRHPPGHYTHDETMTLINRALAYHQAIVTLHDFYISSYAEPELIDVPADFNVRPGERAAVIVKEGRGAIGLKSASTEEENRRGAIPWRVGKFTRDEMAFLDAHPTSAYIPADIAR